MSEQIREALQRLNASDHLAEALPLAEEVERTCVEQSFSVKDLGGFQTYIISHFNRV